MTSRVTKLSTKEKKDKLEDGWIHVNVLFELVGNPKEHIEKTLQVFLDNIATDDNITCIKEEIEETLELEEGKGVFSAAAEVEYFIMGLEKVTWFVFNFMPASIEIKAPDELTFTDKDFSAWINDLLAKLHEVNTIHTALKSEHQQLVKNLNIAIRNNVLLSTEGESKSVAEICKKVGMNETAVQQFLDALVKENKVKLVSGKYKRA